jgi:hypothetical protein
MAYCQKEIGFVFPISSLGQAEGHHEIHERGRHSKHSGSLHLVCPLVLFFLHAVVSLPRRVVLDAVLLDSNYASIHDCIRILKERKEDPSTLGMAYLCVSLARFLIVGPPT